MFTAFNVLIYICKLSMLQHMAKLKADGTERVTNILVVADSKELKRREEQREANRLRCKYTYRVIHVSIYFSSEGFSFPPLRTLN